MKQRWFLAGTCQSAQVPEVFDQLVFHMSLNTRNVAITTVLAKRSLRAVSRHQLNKPGLVHVDYSIKGR